MQYDLTVAINGQMQIILWLKRQSCLHSSGAARLTARLGLLVSYRPLAHAGGMHGPGACGGVFRTEYRGLLRFLAVNPSREIARGTERCPLRAHAVARSGGHRPTHRYPQAAAAACCA